MNQFLVRLVSSLDLRFADPQAESLYHNYYAQVKRNLLPTAIQVVLLVNVLQFLATCLNYYLLVDGRHHYQQDDEASAAPLAASAAATASQAALGGSSETNFRRSTMVMDEYARTLIWPILMQLVVFVATFAMLKMVRAEMRVVNEVNDAEANQSNESLSSNNASLKSKQQQQQHSRHGRSDRTSNDSGHSEGDDNDEEDEEEEEDDDNKSVERISLKQRKHHHQPNSSSKSWAKYTTTTTKQKSTNNTSGRHSGASGLSTSLSLAIEMPLTNPCQHRNDNNNDSSFPNDDQDEESANDSDRDSKTNETVRLSAASERTATTRRKSKASGSSFEQLHLNQSGGGQRRRRFSSNCAQQTKLTRFKLSLPYVLWLCQLIQLASGLWPQQSFIAYSTLLLYSYAIYVIFPIRLHSCILLASGLSLIQPLLDYLLMLNLCNLFGTSNQNDHNNNNNYGGDGQSVVRDSLTSSSLLRNNENNNDHDLLRFVPHKLKADQNNNNNNHHQHSLVTPNSTASDLIALQLQQQHNGSSFLSSGYFPPRTIDSLLNNALEVPMTSQISKLWAFMLLTLGINIIGIMSFFFYERQQRAAYLETRQSLETKLILEQESREQERLLLSILPKHLAAEIRQDLGAVVTGQFKKIYMSRHENVSILFADIVGFTAISSNCPAPELVKTLNELFARFDKLAEKYHQLRIKILGDCYYAISGAPKERPDHAVLCVHMGLSMVEAVKSVRERTKSPVDMRVGVHTGGVLAGVLGQRQWQFDVYSKDVELANKMESSGLPGRVHISNATLRFLNDEFEVTEGDGASREEALRLANIRTYFIDRVKKPYPEGTLDAIRPEEMTPADKSAGSYPAPAEKPQQQQHKKTAELSARPSAAAKKPTATNDHELAVVVADGSQAAAGEKQQPATRNDSFNLDKQIRQFSLNFSNRQFEKQFRSTSDIASCISLVGLPITLLCAFLAYVYLYKIRLEVTIFYTSASSVLLFIVLICVLPHLWRKHSLKSTTTTTTTTTNSATTTTTTAASLQQRQFQCLTNLIVDISEVVGRSAWIKLALSSTMTLIWLGAHLIACKQIVQQFESHQLVEPKWAPSSWSSAGGTPSAGPTFSSLELFSVDLLNYYTITCALAVTAITRISFLVKTILILIVILQQVILNKTILANILMLRSTMLFNDNQNNNNNNDNNQNIGHSNATSTPAKLDSLLRAFTLRPFESISMEFNQFVFMLALVTICWALFLINRQFELTNRRLFLWRKQVEERKEKVADMRRKNEALVYNILPPNVAKIFLGRRQFNDEELYSKSYDAVGVLFAAMPNFSDFYTEESVNNQGLECLRFLNEVISDYDALLDQPRFKNIIKIKTMGPTYMAASGLYEGDAQSEREAAAKAALVARNTTTELGAPVGTSSPLLADGGESLEGESQADQLQRTRGDEIHSKWGHLEQLTEFALALKETLNNINKESFNNFVLRIGINQGPITAGVIGVKKPHFDMWGNTVNVASRMESTGRAGSIQVVEETAIILRHFGFEFDQRGLVSVKGKGKLMTFYLTGRTNNKPPGQQPQQQPKSSSVVGLATSSNGQLQRAQFQAQSQSQSQQQLAQNGSGGGGLNGSVSTDSRQSIVNCSKATIVPKATGGGAGLGSCASLATSNANHQARTAANSSSVSSSNNNISANLGSDEHQQPTAAAGGVATAPTTTTTAPSNADTSDRRMFIRPSKPDFVGDSSADIDLV